MAQDPSLRITSPPMSLPVRVTESGFPAETPHSVTRASRLPDDAEPVAALYCADGFVLNSGVWVVSVQLPIPTHIPWAGRDGFRQL